jgi:hypothetical protein
MASCVVRRGPARQLDRERHDDALFDHALERARAVLGIRAQASQLGLGFVAHDQAQVTTPQTLALGELLQR